MRVFTDGACSHNGKPGAKAGYAVWFPDHPDWSIKKRVPDTESQTNNRAELSAIHAAVEILTDKGYLDEDIVIYTDSGYSIDCLTTNLLKWKARGWKKADGEDVLHRDLIEETSGRLSKFKSYRFHHVRAHTGGGDDLSKNNDVVDRMARSSIDDTVKVETPAVTDELFPGCPLRVLGPPVSQESVTVWLRGHLDVLDKDILNKHLMKAFTEMCKTRDINLTKQTLQKTPMLRAEKGHLQIDRVRIEKLE